MILTAEDNTRNLSALLHGIAAIYMPESATPAGVLTGSKDGGQAPLPLGSKTARVKWKRAIRSRMEAGEVVAVAEIGARSFEIAAPVDGTLIKICVNEGEWTSHDAVLGYMMEN